MPIRTDITTTIARVQATRADVASERDRSRALIAEARRLLARIAERSPSNPIDARKPMRPKRSRLSYKHRWLVARDVVVALRRAGVDCNIVVPPLLAALQAGADSDLRSTGRTLH